MGCGPPTTLTRRLLEAIGVAEPRGLVREFSRRNGLRDVAALAPHVFAAAEEDGDEVAAAIVELSRLPHGLLDAPRRRARRHRGRLPAARGRRPAVAARLRAADRRGLAELPEADPVPLRAEPVFGAVLLALDLAGAGVDEDALLAQHPALLR